ncbi:MAG: isoprenylcysteine carboxylmethyltransferase family protein [Candidatus Bathyarchaeota archaeon]|jgi:protein-S-isoprenylcysteine O-methyltransferase Ste14
MQSPLTLLRTVAGGSLALMGFTVCIRWYLFWRTNFEGDLITHGPYARVRHPFYSGFLGFAVGSALFSPFFETIMLAVFTVAGILYYIPREEAYLLKQYGREYKQYMREVPWRILPRVF